MPIQFDSRQYFQTTAVPADERGAGPEGQQPESTPRARQESAARLHAGLQELRSRSTSVNGLLTGVAGILSGELGANGVWLAIGSNDPQAPQGQLGYLPLLDASDNPLWPLVGAAVEVCSSRAIESGRLVTHDLSSGIRLVVLPINRPGTPGEALAACFSKPESHAAAIGMALAGAAITQWRTDRSIEISGEHVQAAHRMLGLCKSVSEAVSVADACIAIVNQLAVITGATQVCLLTCEALKGTSVRAVSGVENFDKTSPVILSALAAATNLATTGQCLFWQQGENELDGNSQLSAYAREISASGCGLVSIQLTDSARATFLFAYASVFAEVEPYKKRMEQLCTIAGSQLGQCFRLHASPTHRLLARCKQRLGEKLHRNLLIGAAALALLLLCPVPYRVSCETRLEPVFRRFVAAPFDATLERTLAKNGDPVRQGDVVAILDGRDLRMKLSACQAELAAAKKRHDSALATGDISGAQVAKSEARQAEADLGLLEQHLGQLEVRAPIDGIIVSGDLDTAEGIALKTGQTLFEIGPLNRVRAEILIPETELRHVRPDAETTVWLAAWPFQSWPGSISKIHPRSEIVDDQNCFVAEVEMDNPDGRLRPGMKGQGRIRSGWRTLGWVWTHRAWERIRYLTVW